MPIGNPRMAVMPTENAIRVGRLIGATRGAKWGIANDTPTSSAARVIESTARPVMPPSGRRSDASDPSPADATRLASTTTRLNAG
jgi:hypothetical protein